MRNGIKQVWHFNQPPQVVWKFLTEPELIKQWLGKTNFQPVVGHQFRFTSPYGNDSICEVLEVRPCTKLSYSWQKNSAIGNRPFNSKFEWTLFPEEAGTELQLIHYGFAAMEDLVSHEEDWNDCHKQFEELLNTIRQ